MIVRTLLLALCLPALARADDADDWYYHDGPKAGSLKSEGPLPVYDRDPRHLWNRLFAALYIRSSELATRAETSDDTTTLDEQVRKLRDGDLPAGPAVRRIEGGDAIDFPAWSKTRHYVEPPACDIIDGLLDEFLKANGEALIADPLRKAFFQRDLWAVFDHFEKTKTWQAGDAAVVARCDAMNRKLAVILRRLAQPRSVLDLLPDNYAAAVASGRFAREHGFDPQPDYLPAGLLTRPDEWVELDPWSGRGGGQREGRLTQHTVSLKARSYFRVFWRFPGGRSDVIRYLDELRVNGVDWRKTAEDGVVAMKPDAKQIPVGFEGALVRGMMVLDENLKPVPTRIVESLEMRIYKSVDGELDRTTNTGRGMNVYEYVARRRLLFDGLKHGGLEREPPGLARYRVILQDGLGHQDWGDYGIRQTGPMQCLECHVFFKDQVGVRSVYGHVLSVPGLDDPSKNGLAVPMGAQNTYPRGEREARWKLRQPEYRNLVEYASK